MAEVNFSLAKDRISFLLVVHANMVVILSSEVGFLWWPVSNAKLVDALTIQLPLAINGTLTLPLHRYNILNLLHHFSHGGQILGRHTMLLIV
jgi:hypothetical protein